MKRYELTIGDTTHFFHGDDHRFDRDLCLLNIYDKGIIICQAGIHGMILQIRDEEYLKREDEIFADRARRQVEWIDKENETIIDKLKKYFNK